MKKYEIIWTNGDISIGSGRTLNEVLNNLGYSNAELCYASIKEVITTPISSEV